MKFPAGLLMPDPNTSDVVIKGNIFSKTKTTKSLCIFLRIFEYLFYVTEEVPSTSTLNTNIYSHVMKTSFETSFVESVDSEAGVDSKAGILLGDQDDYLSSDSSDTDLVTQLVNMESEKLCGKHKRHKHKHKHHCKKHHKKGIYNKDYPLIQSLNQ